MILEWLGVQLFQIGFASMLGFSVLMFGEVENIGEKFGVGAVIAALGIAFGKYFAFRPKTIEAQAASRRSDMEVALNQNKEVITQLNRVHQERVDNLMGLLADMKERAEKAEAMVAAGRHTRHLMANALAKVQLRAQRYEILMQDAKLMFGTPLEELDLTTLTEEEDEVGRKTKVEPVVTSQAKASAENLQAASFAIAATPK